MSRNVQKNVEKTGAAWGCLWVFRAAWACLYLPGRCLGLSGLLWVAWGFLELLELSEGPGGRLGLRCRKTGAAWAAWGCLECLPGWLGLPGLGAASGCLGLPGLVFTCLGRLSCLGLSGLLWVAWGCLELLELSGGPGPPWIALQENWGCLGLLGGAWSACLAAWACLGCPGCLGLSGCFGLLRAAC